MTPLVLLAPLAAAAQAPTTTRITVLVDAFGARAELRKDWGYAALVEHGGLRILFDTGNDAEILQHNVERLGVDLTDLDLVVLSHRHGDHTDGLRYVLRMNPGVRIVAPDDEYFGGVVPRRFFAAPVESLPPRMRYFDGRVPDAIPRGSPWRGVRVERLATGTTLAPGVRVVSNLSPGPAFTETPELSLVLDTPEGPIVLVGCSHPGIETILASIGAPGGIRLLAGGLHWVGLGAAEVERLADALQTRWRVAAIAPGHCTSERGFAVLSRRYGARYLFAGLGEAFE